MSLPAGRTTPSTLASDQVLPSAIALGQYRVYWIDEASWTVAAVDKLGGPPLVIASTPTRPVDVAASAAGVFWLEVGSIVAPDGAVRRAAPDGSGAQTLAQDILWPRHVAVDETHVYWTSGEGAVSRVPIDGGPVEVLASALPFPEAIALD